MGQVKKVPNLDLSFLSEGIVGISYIYIYIYLQIVSIFFPVIQLFSLVFFLLLAYNISLKATYSTICFCNAKYLYARRKGCALVGW